MSDENTAIISLYLLIMRLLNEELNPEAITFPGFGAIDKISVKLAVDKRP